MTSHIGYISYERRVFYGLLSSWVFVVLRKPPAVPGSSKRALAFGKKKSSFWYPKACGLQTANKYQKENVR